MTDGKEKILSKIKKLFALGTSANENEAALAIEKAQELLDQYNLTMAEVDGVSELNDIVDEIHKKNIKGKDKWDAYLFSGLALAYDCTPYTSESAYGVKTSRIVGHKQDVEVVVATYYYLKNLVNIASDQYLVHYKDTLRYIDNGNKGGNSRKARISFSLGFVLSVLDKIRQRRAARLSASCKTNALVLVRKDKVNEWCKDKLNLRKGTSSRAITRDRDAYGSGMQAGNKANLDGEVTRARSKGALI